MLLNKKIDDFVRYCETLKFYQMVALLFEKFNMDGWIVANDFFTPVDVMFLGEKVDVFNVKTEKIPEIVEDIIQKYGLNVSFCQRLKTNKALSYLVAIGFHDCRLLSVDNKKDFWELCLDGSSLCYEEYHTVEVRLIFKQVTSNRPERPEDETPYYVDRQEVYCLDDGQMLAIFQFSNRGAEFKRLEMEISFLDVEMEIKTV